MCNKLEETLLGQAYMANVQHNEQEAERISELARERHAQGLVCLSVFADIMDILADVLYCSASAE